MEKYFVVGAGGAFAVEFQSDQKFLRIGQIAANGFFANESALFTDESPADWSDRGERLLRQ